MWDRGPVLPRLAVEWGSQDAAGAMTVAGLQERWRHEPASLQDTRSDLPVIAEAATVAFQAPRGRHAR